MWNTGQQKLPFSSHLSPNLLHPVCERWCRELVQAKEAIISWDQLQAASGRVRDVAAQLKLLMTMSDDILHAASRSSPTRRTRHAQAVERVVERGELAGAARLSRRHRAELAPHSLGLEALGCRACHVRHHPPCSGKASLRHERFKGSVKVHTL
jgi:hypothetical protein